MSTILAGQFETNELAEDAVARLRSAGVRQADLCNFAIGPPGQHDQFPVGGDKDESRGTEQADGGAARGAAIGGAVGLAVGIAATPFLGPIAAAGGAGVGAYTGSLVGALGSMDESPDAATVRKAGALVAVNASQSEVAMETIGRVLTEAGATSVERAEGDWSDGEWSDFDPVTTPRKFVPFSSTGTAPPSR
jgi:hypothetical protein